MITPSVTFRNGLTGTRGDTEDGRRELPHSDGHGCPANFSKAQGNDFCRGVWERRPVDLFSSVPDHES